METKPEIEYIAATISPQNCASAAAERKVRVAAYARVSTEQDEQQSSYEAQVDYYTRYIHSNEAWVFAGIYSDAADIIGLNQNPTL